MTDMASASIGTGSPLNCAHANEVPGVCPCGDSCYCKAYTCKNRNAAVADTLTEAQRSEQFRARSGRRMGEFLGALRQARMASAQERLMDNTEAMRESFQYGCGREHPFASGVMARCMGFPHCSVCVKEREVGRLLTRAEYDAALQTVATAGYKRPADLLPFCDIATCPKCGSREVSARYRSGLTFSDPLAPGRNEQRSDWGLPPAAEDAEAGVHRGPERIKRTCERCGYSWDEMPLDGGASG